MNPISKINFTGSAADAMLIVLLQGFDLFWTIKVSGEYRKEA